MKVRRQTRLCLIVFLFLAESLCSLAASGDENWDGSFGVSGADGPIYTIVSTGSEIFFGGRFSQIGGIGATNVAKWNGTNWAPVGGGITGGTFPNVLAMARVNGELYAGGVFTDAGGIVVSNIAEWDGTNWFALGNGVNSIVRALATDGTNLFVGGSFTMAGGINATNIAKWDGTNWSALGGGIAGTAVDSLATSGGYVYAGGRFTSAGGIGATNIAKWDGTNWSALGKGMQINDGVGGGGNTIVRTLLMTGNGLYAGGSFRLAGNAGATNIARWDGVDWAAVGNGIDVSGDVWALFACGVDLYAGGFFSSAGGNAAMSIAKWDGKTWSPLGNGTSYASGAGALNAIVSNGSELFVGGTFQLAGAAPSTNIALWHIPYSLSVSQTGNQVSLSWPATGTNFVLEAKDDVASTNNWSEVSSPPTLHSNECVVTDTLIGSQKVYRLRRK